jgi:hypothetical protein
MLYCKSTDDMGSESCRGLRQSEIWRLWGTSLVAILDLELQRTHTPQQQQQQQSEDGTSFNFLIPANHGKYGYF